MNLITKPNFILKLQPTIWRPLQRKLFQEKWSGDDPPGVLTAPQSSADPPFVEDRPPGKCMEESFQVPDPPLENIHHEPGSCFERFRRWGLAPAMRFNGNPSRETWPGEDPLRTIEPPRASADPPFGETTTRPCWCSYAIQTRQINMQKHSKNNPTFSIQLK